MNTTAPLPQTAVLANEPAAIEEREATASQTAARNHLRLAGLLAALALAAGLSLRFELLTPALDRMTPHTFGALLSLHGALLFYFVLMPLIPGVLGLAVVPRLLDRADIAFPRLARWTPMLLGAGALCLLVGFVQGGTEAGWLFDAEFGGRFTLAGVAPAAFGILLAAIAQIALSANLVATIASSRAAPHPFVSTLFVASLCGAFASAVLATCMALVLADAWGGLAVFDPAAGGDPQLFRFLFRFFTSPAQNALVLTAFGAVAGILFQRTPATPADARGISRVAIGLAVVGALAWENTVAPTAADPIVTLVFSIMNGGLVAIGLVMVGRCLLPASRGLTRIDTATVYAFGFLVTITLCLGSGLLLAMPTTRVLLGSTTFATAHLHLLTLAVAGMAFLGGLHDAWPRLTGRSFSEPLGRFAAITVIAGAHLAFLPRFVLGLSGASFRANEYAEGAQVLNILSTAGATVLLAGLVLAAANLAFGRRVADFQ